ncbi:MAG TPA: NAD(P)H-dependent oxidoreductase subunit E [Gemmatimonadaceae bacterium]|nr:NAD(P)H-dependent oxidoreductase subunit E [Gemmatimonadaceae bacterium]
MDIRSIDSPPTHDERDAVDALLGTPASSWEGGARGSVRDAHTAHVGGKESRALRHLLLPALQALQSRVGWISEGGLGYVCDRLNVPPADAWAVATFYALLATSPRPRRVVHVCDDIACKCRGADALIATLEKSAGPGHAHAPVGEHVTISDSGAIWMHSPCLGMCDQAPAALVTEAGEAPRETLLGNVTASEITHILEGKPPQEKSGASAASQQLQSKPDARLLARTAGTGCTELAEYEMAGGYGALRKAIELGGDAVIAEISASKLMGRGGAAFPTGRKWDAVAKQPALPHYFICNADESEPGTFKDRVLMEQDPFAIIEAMTIGAFATKCEQGFIYIRGEYPLAAQRLQHAIDEARAKNYLGANVLGAGFAFDIEVRRGGGAYICGEETALFESIEGKRGEPRNKPPFPVQHGLFGKPTVVNNVETLANIPGIVLDGGAAYAAIGTPQSTGTRLFCLCGNVQQPGVYEAPAGVTLRSVIDMAGGVTSGRSIQAVLLGGAAGTFVRPDELDLKLTHEDTRAANTTLGSGVIMVFDDTIDMKDIVRRIAAFFRDESCGQCVPCRVGTVRQEEALYRLAAAKGNGPRANGGELALLEEIGVGMRDASICGLGQTAYSAVESAIKRLRLYEDVKT